MTVYPRIQIVKKNTLFLAKSMEEARENKNLARKTIDGHKYIAYAVTGNEKHARTLATNLRNDGIKASARKNEWGSGYTIWVR
jgi:hypothetical protein